MDPRTKYWSKEKCGLATRMDPWTENLIQSKQEKRISFHSTFRFRFESRSEWLNEKKEDRGRMSGIGIRQIGPECVFIETWIIDSWLIITVTYITANVTIRNRQNWRIVITWVRQPCSKFRTVAKCNWARELMKTKISQICSIDGKNSNETILKMGQPKTLLHLFSSFSAENRSSEQDSNSDHRGRRQGHWPLDYHHRQLNLNETLHEHFESFF